MTEPTSFDALACEMRLSSTMRDLTRIFFRDGLNAGRGRAFTAFEERAAEHSLTQANRQIARAFYDLGIRIGTRQARIVRGGFPAEGEL